MTATTASYFIYYRVRPGFDGAARALVATILQAMEERFAITGRLLRREDDASMWMEIYENVRNRESFEAAMRELLLSLRFGEMLAPGSARVVECFIAGQA